MYKDIYIPLKTMLWLCFVKHVITIESSPFDSKIRGSKSEVCRNKHEQALQANDYDKNYEGARCSEKTNV